jgi:hypothetical protein
MSFAPYQKLILQKEGGQGPGLETTKCNGQSRGADDGRYSDDSGRRRVLFEQQYHCYNLDLRICAKDDKH